MDFQENYFIQSKRILENKNHKENLILKPNDEIYIFSNKIFDFEKFIYVYGNVNVMQNKAIKQA